MRNRLILLIGLYTMASAGPVTPKDPSTLTRRDILKPLPESASALELEYQPLVDFDMDGCYNTAAIDPSGRTNPGKGATASPQGRCRDKVQLENANVYSRSRCNNGYCAIMYEYYFKKDQSIGFSFLAGHRHDWENVVVFIKDGKIVRVAPACLGKYGRYVEVPAGTGPDSIRYNDAFHLTGNHTMLVYHKDSLTTHCFRLSRQKDVEDPENPFKAFHRAPLVGWKHWPSKELREKMLNARKGRVGPKLDQEFARALEDASGGALPDFNPYKDEEMNITRL